MPIRIGMAISCNRIWLMSKYELISQCGQRIDEFNSIFAKYSLGFFPKIGFILN